MWDYNIKWFVQFAGFVFEFVGQPGAAINGAFYYKLDALLVYRWKYMVGVCQ